jgi:hypothetical protein
MRPFHHNHNPIPTRYCSRELIDSDGVPLDLRGADMFSLGASIYEMCLGRELGTLFLICISLSLSHSLLHSISLSLSLSLSLTHTHKHERTYTLFLLLLLTPTPSLSLSPGSGSSQGGQEWHTIRNGVLDSDFISNYSVALVKIIKRVSRVKHDEVKDRSQRVMVNVKKYSLGCSLSL